MAGFPKDSSLGVSMDILKTNTLKAHTGPRTVLGRPTPKGVERFQNRSAESFYYGVALRKQLNLKGVVFYEDRFAKIHVSSHIQTHTPFVAGSY